MKRRLRQGLAALLAVVVLTSPGPVRAQAVLVYDEANWFQAVLEFFQILEQYLFMIAQARRLPVDLAKRYAAWSPPWPVHDEAASLLYAKRVLNALNVGDPSGDRYREIIDLLDVPADAVGRMPAELRRRLGTQYATIELADSVAVRGVDHAGTARGNGELILQTIDTMERDAASTNDTFHTQTALLNKINTAAVLGLRIGEHTNQFLLETLEQLLVDNKRKRDSEVKVMNATIHQWRYGTAYGTDLFRNTAANLNGWRPY